MLKLKSGPITIRLWGPRGLFTVPHLRADPFSYPVMTPSAAKGILRAIYWKPEWEWEVDEIRVCRPIQYASYTTQYVVDSFASHPRSLTSVTLLLDLEYVLVAHVAHNPYRTGRPAYDVRQMLLEKMGRGEYKQQPSFGKREHWAFYELLDGPDAGPSPIRESRLLPHFLYDQIPVDLDKDQFRPVFWSARMDNGIVTVPSWLHEQNRDDTMKARMAVHPVLKKKVA